MFYALIIIFIVVIDQASKYFATSAFKGGSDFSIIDGIFSLTYLENRGAAFGFFSGQKFITIGVTTIVIIALIVYLYNSKFINMRIKIVLSLIIGGAIGNLIDRIYHGYVVDFFHFYIEDVFNFPVFNVADISVVCGTILMAIIILFSKEEWVK